MQEDTSHVVPMSMVMVMDMILTMLMRMRRCIMHVMMMDFIFTLFTTVLVFILRMGLTMKPVLLLMFVSMVGFVMTLIMIMYRCRRSGRLTCMRVCMLGTVGVVLFGVIAHIVMFMTVVFILMLDLSETLEGT